MATYVETRTAVEAGARGTLFLVLLWAAFVLPIPTWTAFPFIVGHTNLSELALIAMPFVYALYPRQRAAWHTKKLQYAILGFFLFCILNNLFQKLIYGGSITEFLRVHRPLIPLYFAMAVIYLGPRVRPRLLLANLAACLSISFMISLIFFFFNLDFQPFFQAEVDEQAYEIIKAGRIYNVNAGFSYLALALINFILYFRQKLKIKKLVRVLLLACTLSILTSVLSFNRTFLVISALFFVIVILFFFRLRVVSYMLRVVSYIMIMSLAIALMGIYSYQQFDIVQRQINRRLINPLKDQAIIESVYYGNRNYLYESYMNVGKQYFLTGVPPHVPWALVGSPVSEIRTTDISFVTVMLRNGVLSLIFYLLTVFLLYRGIWRQRKKSLNGWAILLNQSLIIAIPFMVIASFNIDILARHYAIVFLALMFIALQDDIKSNSKRLYKT